MEEGATLKVTIKGTRQGLGIHIVGGKMSKQKFYPVFIKEIERNSLADIDGRLKRGDQILEVNERSLIGVSFQKALNILKACALTNEVAIKISRDSMPVRKDFYRLSSGISYADLQSHTDVADSSQQETSIGEISQTVAVTDKVVRDLKEKLREAESRESAAKKRVIEAERGLAEYEKRIRQLETQWVVRRAEIQLTGPELGKGGWSTVSVATFRKAQVAAKSIHHQIVSPHNLKMFQREMNMAARLRHPNLVQFIGATTEGEMMILTELMPTSLRKELQNDYMPPRQVISIGLDVARALNYLHLMQPDPIIHRDINSANVLLEPISSNKWRAKVSDYGSVNILQKLQTECPGSPAYSAPEANKPRQQSPKMDIYSYGALLLEMLTGELPIREERGRLIRKVHKEELLALIRRCLTEKREDRPNAIGIISELEVM